MVFPSLDDALRIKPSGLYGVDAHDNAKKGFGGVSVPMEGRLASLLRVPSNYLFEIHKEGALETAICLPLDPEDIQFSRPTPTDVRFTFGRLPIRDHSQHRFMRIEISGRSGLAPRSGYNRFGEIVFDTGPTILREFDAFLDAYQSAASKPKSTYLNNPDRFRGSEEIRLVFRALEEKMHVLVEVEEFRRMRNTSASRHSEQFRLTLLAYAPAEPKAPMNIFSPVSDWFSYATQTIGLANAYVATADNALRNIRNDLEVFRGPLRALQQTGILFQDVAGNLQDIANFPRALWGDLVGVIGQFENVLDETAEIGDLIGGYFPLFDGVEFDAIPSPTKGIQSRLIRDGEILADQATIAAGTTGGGPEIFDLQERSRNLWPAVNPLADGAVSNTERTSGEGGDVIAYRWRAGDTPETVARAFYGERAAWADIAAFNGWSAEGVTGQGQPIEPGVSILLPNTGFGRAVQPVAQEDDVFGVDILLDPETGDFALTPDGTDIQLARGVDNFVQALRMRSWTTQGESTVFPSYGLPISPGQTFSASDQGYLAAHIREQYARDPRVAEVEQVNLEDGGDTLQVEVLVRSIQGDTSTIIAPVKGL